MTNLAALSWKSLAFHPSKLCCTTGSIAGKAFTEAIAVLQVYQVKMLKEMYETDPDLDVLKELRTLLA